MKLEDCRDEIVMRDSPEAAQYRTGIRGWVSRHGHYYGDGPQSEASARYAGCTHVGCSDCGAPTRKGSTKCRECRNKAEIARHESRPRAEWDGKAMLYSEARDKFYESPDDAEDDLDDGETLADMRLVICEPIYARQLEPDYFADDMAEDGELPAAVEEAMEVFNKSVAGILLSWSPGKVALALPEEIRIQAEKEAADERT